MVFPAGTPWRHSTVDPQFAIGGLGPEYITTDHYDELVGVMTDLLGFKQIAKDGQVNIPCLNSMTAATVRKSLSTING